MEREKQMNDMADIELKPCPFCGSKDIELRAGVVLDGAAHCKNCSADVVFDAVRMIAEGDYDWKTAVTDGWNNRTEDVVPRSEVVEEVLAKVKELVKEYMLDKGLYLATLKHALNYAEKIIKGTE